MKSALFWVFTQRMVVILTDISGNISVTCSRFKKSKKIKTLQDRTDILSRNVDKKKSTIHCVTSYKRVLLKILDLRGETLGRAAWRTLSGKGYGLVARQSRQWMCRYPYTSPHVGMWVSSKAQLAHRKKPWLKYNGNSKWVGGKRKEFIRIGILLIYKLLTSLLIAIAISLTYKLNVVVCRTAVFSDF